MNRVDQGCRRRVAVGVGSALLMCLGACRSDDLPAVTFNRDVAPILFEHCTDCHRPGGAGPFSLMDYHDARKRARQVLEVTGSRFMPPWQPAPGYAEYVGQRGLSDAEIATLRAWVDGKVVQGDPADLPPVPAVSEDWQLGPPDLTVEMDRAYALPASGADVLRNFVIPLPLTEGRWVRAVEVHPGDKRAVHHAIAKIDTTGISRRLDLRDPGPGFEGMDMGGAESPDGHTIVWAPGTSADAGVEGLAWRLEPGAELVLQMHMVPTGRSRQVRASIGFHFAENAPRLRPLGLLLQSLEIDIPAGDSDFVVSDELVLPSPVSVLTVFPHAHYLGRQLHAWAELPDGEQRWLIRIDDWDFNWQGQYRFVDPIPLPAGTRLRMRYAYDNSANNVRNPNIPPRRVTGGNRSTDEMATLLVQVLPRNEAERDAIQLAQFEKLLRDNPRNPVTLYNLGVVHAERGEATRAVEYYERALAIDPGDAAIHFYAGNVYYHQRDWGRARPHYEAAVRITPEFVEAHYLLAAVLDRLGDPARAEARYRLALEVDPTFAPTHRNLGSLLARRGDRRSAERHLRRALELQPDLPGAADALRRLQINP